MYGDETLQKLQMSISIEPNRTPSLDGALKLLLLNRPSRSMKFVQIQRDNERWTPVEMM